MRGQMYDYYLDPNACLFGLRKGSEVLHIMCNPVTGRIMVVNNGFNAVNDWMIIAKTYDIEGNETLLVQELGYVEASDAKKLMSVKSAIDRLTRGQGGFLYLQLLDRNKNILSDNLYWYPDAEGNYSGLNQMKPANVSISAKALATDKIEVTVSNPKGNPVAFFNRISLIDAKTSKRILPAFYDENYVSILPGEDKKIVIEYLPKANITPQIEVRGWNVMTQIKNVGL
jgi:hypothetical protein